MSTPHSAYCRASCSICPALPGKRIHVVGPTAPYIPSFMPCLWTKSARCFIPFGNLRGYIVICVARTIFPKCVSDIVTKNQHLAVNELCTKHTQIVITATQNQTNPNTASPTHNTTITFVDLGVDFHSCLFSCPTNNRRSRRNCTQRRDNLPIPST